MKTEDLVYYMAIGTCPTVETPIAQGVRIQDIYHAMISLGAERYAEFPKAGDQVTDKNLAIMHRIAKQLLTSNWICPNCELGYMRKPESDYICESCRFG